MINFNKKLMTFFTFTIFLVGTPYAQASGVAFKNISFNQETLCFIRNEAITDVTDFLTKDGTFCRIIRLGGYVWAANKLTDFIHDNITPMSERTKKIVKVGLLATAYVGYKLKKLSRISA